MPYLYTKVVAFVELVILVPILTPDIVMVRQCNAVLKLDMLFLLTLFFSIKTFPHYQLLRSNKSPSEFFGIFLHIYLKFTFTRLRPAAGIGRLEISAFSWMRSFPLSFDILIIRIQLRSQGFTLRSWLGFRFWTWTKRLRFFIFCGIGSRFAFSYWCAL